MPDRLYFTASDAANALIASDPMALLVGFALDQQVTVQKAFSGPLVIRERIGDPPPLRPSFSSFCAASLPGRPHRPPVGCVPAPLRYRPGTGDL